ncbi:mycofactocin biosynthesis glycosyltransferase MftF [Streptomyces sp. NPDC088194]|uniref:mycofactocin biosynthesis glycosyltransferase MftF n=1 Tax=Streptomyces sp. NPDC088194 TaxID=3154931 RepID=UPI00344E60AF
MTLPVGSVVELGSRVRRYDRGRVLVGGAPPRLLRLSAPAVALLAGRRIRIDGPTSLRLATRLVALGMAHPVVTALPPADLGQLTVVVPAHGRPDALERLLAGVAGRVEVIVVDDASPDPDPVARVAHRHGARLIRHPGNRGPAAARNTGLRQVRTPFVAFIDSDITVEPDTLPMLLRHFHDPELAVVAPRVLGLHGPGTPERGNWIVRYEGARSSLDLQAHPALVHPRSRVSWVPSACLVARVDALGPGFTESMRVGEDVDLVWRLAAEGHRVRYEPSVAVRHDHRSGLADWLGRKAYYGTGAHTLSARHGPAVAPAVLTPWAAAVGVAALAQRRWSLPAAAVVLTAVTRRNLRKVPAGSAGRHRIAVSLTGLGVAATAEQAAALLLRHWWPLSLAGCVVSSRARRAVALAAVADGLLEYRLRAPDLDPVRFALARRLDDLAYGSGLWAGAVRGRSIRCLLPEIRRSGAGAGAGVRARSAAGAAGAAGTSAAAGASAAAAARPGAGTRGDRPFPRSAP